VRPAASLKASALRWLAMREHSRSEMQAKLLRRARRIAELESHSADALPATPLPEVLALLEELEEKGLLSETRFVESRVHARAARFGNRRIESELGQHRLKLDVDTAQVLKASEPQRAWGVWERRYGQAPADAKERQRQTRFLMSRGFSAQAIRQVFQRLGQVADDSGDEP
jgi:regulatory protein